MSSRELTRRKHNDPLRSGPTQQKPQRESKSLKIEWIKALTPLDPFQSQFAKDWFDARLIYSWLAYRGNLTEPQASSINEISSALLIGTRGVKKLLKRLGDADLAEPSSKGWLAKEPPEGWFRTYENQHGKGWYDSICHLKLYLPAPGKMIGDRRWGITHCAVWSLFLSLRKKNQINCFASQAAAMLGLSVRCVRGVVADFEQGGLIAREQNLGKASEYKVLPLNGHHALFVSKTPKAIEPPLKPASKPQSLSDELQEMVNALWPHQADFLTWKSGIMEIQKKTCNGLGSPQKYLEKCIREKYLQKYPTVLKATIDVAELGRRMPVLTVKQCEIIIKGMHDFGHQIAKPGRALVWADGVIDLVLGSNPQTYDELTDRLTAYCNK
jgi:hypothetical protein